MKNVDFIESGGRIFLSADDLVEMIAEYRERVVSAANDPESGGGISRAVSETFAEACRSIEQQVAWVEGKAKVALASGGVIPAKMVPVKIPGEGVRL